jgi:glutamate racemase
LQAEFAIDLRLLRFAAPDLVHAAEAKMRGEYFDANIVTDALSGLTEQAGGDKLDTVILGCTHFPLLEQEFKDISGTAITYVDGAQGIARRVARLSEGRIWPSMQKQGIFVTTGKAAEMEPYRATLARYGFTKIESL